MSPPQKKLPWREVIRCSFNGRRIALLLDAMVVAVAVIMLLAQYSTYVDSWCLPAFGAVIVFGLVEFHWLGEELYDRRVYFMLMEYSKNARVCIEGSWSSPKLWSRFFRVILVSVVSFLTLKFSFCPTWGWEQLFWTELVVTGVAGVIRFVGRLKLHRVARALA